MKDQLDFPTIIQKFDEALSRGLSIGLGDREGQMCIEAAICYALNLPHGDNPNCVTLSVSRYKTTLNDSTYWISPQSRAKHLRNLGIAQLGSKSIVTDKDFSFLLVIKTISVLVPTLFRDLFPGRYETLLLLCEKEPSYINIKNLAAIAAANAANATDIAANAAYAAAAAADAYADAAAYAAAADAAAYAAANATYAAYAAYATADAAAYAADAAASYTDAAADAADAANAAADAAAIRFGESEKYLILSANLALEILKELKSPGCEWI